MSRRLEVSLGPVQTWIVGQARRTRDLWAGSFLLSWLTAQAACAVLEHGGRLRVPRTERRGGDATGDPMVRAVWRARQRGPRAGLPLAEADSPLIGSLPNHFIAEVPDGFDPGRAVGAIHDAWWRLADAVWMRFLAPALRDLDGSHPSRTGTPGLWRAQIGRCPALDADGVGEHLFWEAVWVTGDAGAATLGVPETEWLPRRKTWRTFAPFREDRGYDHCRLMPDWPEVSGLVRARQRAQQEGFWQALRDTVARALTGRRSDPHLQTLELRQGERLCALALVKRLFPLLPDGELRTAIGWVPGEGRFRAQGFDPARGSRQIRDVLRNWPSTAYMAAIDWIRAAWQATPDECVDYGKRQAQLVHHAHRVAEIPSRIRSFREVEDARFLQFAQLDGPLFFSRAIDADRFAVDTPDRRAELAANHRTLLQALKEPGRRGAGRPLSAGPAPFYALLMMDGDRIGAFLERGAIKDEVLSDRLGAFASGAANAVEAHDGVTLYAGGDDLLAMLPLGRAIAAAHGLHDHWHKQFEDLPAPRPTISAGLVFADYQVSLAQVRDEARRLLDEVAKGRNRRDSLAVSVLKSGGRIVEWVSAWHLPDGRRPGTALWDLAARFAASPDFSSSYVYRLRARYAGLFAVPAAVVDERLMRLMRQVLVAEYVAGHDDRAAAAAVADSLLLVSQRHRRPAEPADPRLTGADRLRRGPAETDPRSFGFDAAMLVRFLGVNGMFP